MQSDPWVLGQPVPDGGMLVGAVVVQHHLRVSAPIGPSDELEEDQELGVSMPVNQRPVTLPVATSSAANRLR
jgi:hypothetical protein